MVCEEPWGLLKKGRVWGVMGLEGKVGGRRGWESELLFAWVEFYLHPEGEGELWRVTLWDLS